MTTRSMATGVAQPNPMGMGPTAKVTQAPPAALSLMDSFLQGAALDNQITGPEVYDMVGTVDNQFGPGTGIAALKQLMPKYANMFTTTAKDTVQELATDHPVFKGTVTTHPSKTVIQLPMHIHSFLKVFVNGKQITLPGNIGREDPNYNDHHLDQFGDDGGVHLAPVHTHDSSGKIHVESSVTQDYTLGELLDIWGHLDLKNKNVSVTAQGQPIQDYRNLVLQNGEDIEIHVWG